MFTGTQSIFINGNKKKVYEVAQTYPSFVRFFLKGSRVLQETDNTMEVEVHAKWFGFYKTKWQGYGKKDPCNLIHFTQTQGLFKGLIALWRFEETSGGTHVTIETTFSKPDLTKYGEFLLGRFLVERTTEKILSELKHCVENNVANK